MIAEMEARRQRIDDALARLHNDMLVNVDGVGHGKIVCIFAYSVDVRVRLATGQVIDTTAFELTPLEVDNHARRTRSIGAAGTRTHMGIAFSQE